MDIEELNNIGRRLDALESRLDALLGAVEALNWELLISAGAIDSDSHETVERKLPEPR